MIEDRPTLLLNKQPIDLATELSELSYVGLSTYIFVLASKIISQGHKDHDLGRHKLARELFQASAHLQDAAFSLDAAWQICKTHMNPNRTDIDNS